VLAKELVALRPDVILAHTTPMAAALAAISACGKPRGSWSGTGRSKSRPCEDIRLVLRVRA
jgi:hypothetical protein